ncbi:hypothetical protein CMQ_5564 [Grosmannia clavigera kw1407]|uniref:Uncharacterized protein n=1 Tax=Grosmannia clavigera (strain kw1407 / UAMH 11150) TaxID=655863 RepID=F0XSL0_GROCL|nr:uncharacterized protein CMQ_5564 [Grosmannia clavigera kw1407]EFW99143.1 hypothetical protein CMQ_5564 [Grosmannia clavigera kw1407]
MADVPPVSKDGFTFSGELYAETTGHKLHRRAMAAELRALYKSNDEKDYPGHWYEAQLMHYGLRRSRVKSTAKMRLFEFVVKRYDRFCVPPDILKIKAQLRTEWRRNLRQARRNQNMNRQNSGPAVEPHAANWENMDGPRGSNMYDGSGVNSAITAPEGYNVTLSIRSKDRQQSGQGNAGQAQHAGPSTPGQSWQANGTPREVMTPAGRAQNTGQVGLPSHNNTSAEAHDHHKKKKKKKNLWVDRGAQGHAGNQNSNNWVSNQANQINQAYQANSNSQKDQRGAWQVENQRRRHHQMQQQNMRFPRAPQTPTAARAFYGNQTPQNVSSHRQTTPGQRTGTLTNGWSSPYQPYAGRLETPQQMPLPPACGGSCMQRNNGQNRHMQGRDTPAQAGGSGPRHVHFR